LFRVFGGLTYARIQERLISAFAGAPMDPPCTPLYLSLNKQTNFWGVGPRIGVDTSYNTPIGLRFTGNFAGALLVGRTQPSQYQFTATSDDLATAGIDVNQQSIASPSFVHVVYAATARLGAGYTLALPRGRFISVDGGWMAALYVNPLSGYE